jgi:hypothetical protein
MLQSALLALLHCTDYLFLFFQALQVTKARISRSQGAQQLLRIAKLVETNAQLRAGLHAAQSRLVELERRERALTSDYEGLNTTTEYVYIIG